MEGGKRGGPTLSPSTAGSCSTMENGVSDLPTDPVILDPPVILGWVGSLQEILHLVIKQTMLFRTLPSVNTLVVFVVNLLLVRHCVWPLFSSRLSYSKRRTQGFGISSLAQAWPFTEISILYANC